MQVFMGSFVRAAGSACGVLAMLAWSAGAVAGPSGGAAGAPKAASAAARPPGEDAGKSAKVGAHDVTTVDAERLSEEMRKARGHDLFVHLWASWCGPCLEELPVINRFARAARARGATFLSISLDDARRGAHVMEVLRQRAPNLTAFVARFDDPDRFISLFSSEWEGAIPALFAYDHEGRLRGSVIGEVEPGDLARMLADIDAPPSDPRRR